ncbi:MAG: hypothetical protein ACD_78C00360G0002 [uncultured bacterium (gcode 4)]|uniref:Uncharacterized protein n=1 Tax=uncultured bacterium (gcode 4) TaxID=1234023 RepID=K1YWB4_9BACT|nr:MAG: hypothetical protein ACD_78C00360G0002 [uncultured bacterium (gcode 4)]
MPRSNIVFFTGANRIFLHRDLDKWIEVFALKYGEYNISRLDVGSLAKVNIAAELLTPVFLGEKRLIVIDGIPASTISAESEKSTVLEDAESAILSALDTIPDSSVVLFVESTPDKRKSLYKRLAEIATIKDYPLLEGPALREYIRKKIPHIDITAISRLIEFTGADINRIESELDKLSLYKQDGWITEEDIRSYVLSNIESSIFALTDAIFALDSVRAHAEFLRIIETHNIHQTFTTLISTLRTFLYSARLIELKYGATEVRTILKIHPFAFEKMQRFTKFTPRIRAVFDAFLLLDRRVKVGEGIGDTDDALRLGIEKTILCLQKT